MKNKKNLYDNTEYMNNERLTTLEVKIGNMETVLSEIKQKLDGFLNINTQIASIRGEIRELANEVRNNLKQNQIRFDNLEKTDEALQAQIDGLKQFLRKVLLIMISALIAIVSSQLYIGFK